VLHKVTAIKLFQYPCRISKNPVTEGFQSSNNPWRRYVDLDETNNYWLESSR
jgi:hypothetical protein